MLRLKTDVDVSVVLEIMFPASDWLSDILSVNQLHGVSSKKSKPEIT